MSKRKGFPDKGRLWSASQVRPEGGRTVACSVPELPLGKFRQCPGQLAMDFSRDEWDAVSDPDE